MNKSQLKDLFNEYKEKYDEIIKIYGKKDGFLLDDTIWWVYYKNRIEELIAKIKENTITEDDFSKFYKEFGFGVKLYNITFIESGIKNLNKVFLYLVDKSITAEEKIKNVVEETDSEFFIKGIGTHFVTLFLTSCFPDEYVNWNAQTDGALKILNLYPDRDRGETKSSFYNKINNVCKELLITINAESLPRVDNFLYCINKGYIGSASLVEKKITEETKKIEEISEELIDKTTGNKHDEMMYYLIKIGVNKNYDVFVADNDKGKTYNNEKFSDLCLSTIPNFTQPMTLSTARYIDVIWFKKNTSYPVRFIEIEHSTSIYSGLLRLNDVKIDYPIDKATIVLPKERMSLFETQIKRRTFTLSELSDVCDCMTYEDLKKWYEATKVDVQFN